MLDPSSFCVGDGYTLQCNIGAFFAGATFFPCGFAVLSLLFGSIGLSQETVYMLSSRLMSGTQAVLCCVAGCLIVSSCGEDIMTDRHWLAEPYACFMTAYLFYDSVVMVYTFQRLNQPHSGESYKQSLMHFIGNKAWNLTYLFHHLMLPIFFLPVVLYFRRGLGDYFLGCFMMIEAFIPFSCIRDILIQFELQRSSLYLFNGLLLLVVYFQCRILVFPFLYWRYAQHTDISFSDVPYAIPRICNIGSAFLLVLFSYWFLHMVKAAHDEIVQWMKRSSTAAADECVKGRYAQGADEFVPLNEFANKISVEKKTD